MSKDRSTLARPAVILGGIFGLIVGLILFGFASEGLNLPVTITMLIGAAIGGSIRNRSQYGGDFEGGAGSQRDF